MMSNTEMTIAGYTVDELAEQWIGYLKERLSDTIKYHAEGDEDFVNDMKGVIPAEILNSAEQDAWETLRTEFSAFAGGDWAAVEEKIAEKVIPLKAEIDYDSIVAESIA